MLFGQGLPLIRLHEELLEFGMSRCLVPLKLRCEAEAGPLWRPEKNSVHAFLFSWFGPPFTRPFYSYISKGSALHGLHLWAKKNGRPLQIWFISMSMWLRYTPNIFTFLLKKSASCLFFVRDRPIISRQEDFLLHLELGPLSSIFHLGRWWRWSHVDSNLSIVVAE